MLSLMLAMLFCTTQAHTEPFAWSGIVPGTHNRQAIEKRFGSPAVITKFGESEYSLSEIERGGQDKYIPAKSLLIGYDKKGVVLHIRIRPISYEFDQDWLETNFGKPDCWVTDKDGVKLAGVYHQRRIVALMSANSSVEELFMGGL
jgi:hypothetical protein